MRILNPSLDKTEEKKIHYIIKEHVYIRIFDYGKICLLKEFCLEPGLSTWYWINIRHAKAINLGDVRSNFSSFDESINRAVNDLFSTIYVFENYKEVVEKWGEIKYNDEIRTIYKSNGSRGDQDGL